MTSHTPLDTVRDSVRSGMTRLARLLNTVSRGKITPNFVTLVGFGMHIPIALLIARGYFGYAAILLVIFGLFDALDGALARLQGKAGNAGMVLDASTDRLKEVILYTGVAYALIEMDKPYWVMWAVLACGLSVVVSYVKAKGETAVAGGKFTANEVNRLFQDGLGRFEIRMAILVVGLLANRLEVAVAAIAIISGYTVLERLVKIMRKLS